VETPEFFESASTGAAWLFLTMAVPVAILENNNQPKTVKP